MSDFSGGWKEGTRVSIESMGGWGSISTCVELVWCENVLSSIYVVLHTRSCYGSVKNGFDSAILTKIPRMKKEERLGRRQTTKCGAKRQAHTLSQDHATTDLILKM
jgi:hypothetical protein